jgi:3-deoxy-manno-octulosonate cytidylyltransferase (CMP-KDO synthetase)
VKIVACIPARFSSTRFPGKVLAKDTGKFLIQHVYEHACQAKLIDRVIIAADDRRIVDAAKSFGAECVLTSVRHKSGTDRIAEAVKKIEDRKQKTEDRMKKDNEICLSLNNNDIMVNLQADEPEIDPANIDFVARLLLETKKSKLKNQNYGMATLAAPFDNAEQIADPNIVKVVVTSIACPERSRGKRRATSNEPVRAIYFSRSPIPYDREKAGIGKVGQYLRHIGIYAYRKEFLLKITSLPQTPLEKIEKLEQLRAIENDFGILVGKVKHTCDGIDTPEQYAEFVKRYKISHPASLGKLPTLLSLRRTRRRAGRGHPATTRRAEGTENTEN